MEIKAVLEKPYTDEQRAHFIVVENHTNGYLIKETDKALEAWGLTAEEELASAKEAKYREANIKANEYLQSGEALFEFEEGKHVEATDGNIAKMNAYITAYITGQLGPEDTVVWNTKEDETVHLNQAQIGLILLGLGQVQAMVWTEEFPVFIEQINAAETVEDVNAIVISYGTVPNEEPSDEEPSEEEIPDEEPLEE